MVQCYGKTARIKWAPGRDNGAGITGFTVQFNMIDTTDDWFDYYEKATGNATEQRVELSPYGSYNFRVKAFNTVGLGPPSDATMDTCQTPPDRPDRNPQGPRTRTDEKGYLVIEWEPLHRLSWHGPGFRYEVRWRHKGMVAWTEQEVNGSQPGQASQ